MSVIVKFESSVETLFNIAVSLTSEVNLIQSIPGVIAEDKII